MLNRRDFVGAASAAALAAPQLACARAAGPVSFLALGDFGRDGAAHQREVARQMGVEAGRIDSQFVVTLGDNFYNDGVKSAVDPQWRSSFEDIYTAKSLQKPWLATLGNHDYRGNPQAQLEYAAASARWRLPSRYYVHQVRQGGVVADLFMLDTAPMVAPYRDSKTMPFRQNVLDQDPEAQLRWLEAALKASTAPWKFAFGHHPVFSGGEHGDQPELVARVRPLFETYGVQLYVNGHDHDLQRIERSGVTYVCSGAGSETRSVKGVQGTRFCADRSGFTSYRLDRDRLSVSFVDWTGQTLHTATIDRDASKSAKAA